MDTLLAAQRLPRLAERAMRAAIAAALARGQLAPSAVIDRALVTFEAALAGRGVRPALLFAERDRIVRELRAFLESRLATRLRALPRRSFVASGSAAAPFDALVRNRRGRTYAVVFARLPNDGRRLAILQRMRTAGQTKTRTPIDGVLVYDFSRAVALRLDQAGAQSVHRYLRAS
ncbi:MAG: hypothetical protein ABR949_04765 [Candidatus Aquilonibacter sp.]|jgi:hypothetical protein